MEQLLKIESIPMSIEMKINNGTYEIASGNATVEISRDPGGFKMKMQPTKLRLDSFEARNSMNQKSPFRSTEEYAQKGIQAGYQAIGNYAKEGSMLLDIKVNDGTIVDLVSQKFASEMAPGNFNIGFSPAKPIEMEFSEPDLAIRYEMDKLNFDWKINRPQIEFTPGDIEIIIKEYARLEIEYVGDPIYVPPSSNPSYEAPPTLDTKA